jgi:apolipoprotein N-acyltransferase
VASTKRKTARQWLPALAAAVFGAVLSVAFPPEGLWWLAPLTVAGFTCCCQAAAGQREQQRGRRRPAAAGGFVGLCFGLTFCVIFFRWITSIGVDVWLGLAVLETLFFIPLGIGTAALGRLRGAPLWQAMLWVAEEAVRDRFPLGGMSWGRLAFSQTDTPFTPLAALGGAPLVTFATALAGTVLAAVATSWWRRSGAAAVLRARLRRRGTVEPGAAAIGQTSSPVGSEADGHASARLVAAEAGSTGSASAGSDSPNADSPSPVPAGSARSGPAASGRGPLGWRAATAWAVLAVAVPAVGWLVPLQTTAGKPVEMAAIQGNVVQPGINSYGTQDAVLNNHLLVTQQYAAEVAAGKVPQPAAVIWPEDSDDVDPFAYPSVYYALTQAAANIKAPILVGAVVGIGPGQVRSEGIVWSPTTGAGASYSKRHLVPFGEYIPWRSFLTKYFSELNRVPDDFVPGNTPGALTIGGVNIADVICFEVAYDDIVRSSVNSDSGVIVVQTNNADYGWTGQPEQQLAISQLRAVESGRPVLIASTSGISGYITPDGAIAEQTGQFVPAVVAADITPRTGLTLADRVGAAPEWAMSALACAAWLFALLIARRRRRVEPAGQASALVATSGRASDGAANGAPDGAPVPAPGGEQAAEQAVEEVNTQTEARKAPA